MFKLHHNSKLYFKCSTLLVPSLNFKSNLVVKMDLFLNSDFAIAILDLISRMYLASFCYRSAKIVEIFYILQLFLICHNL